MFILFTFGCTGSSLQLTGFLQLPQARLLFIVIHGLLVAVAFLVAEHGL